MRTEYTQYFHMDLFVPSLVSLFIFAAKILIFFLGMPGFTGFIDFLARSRVALIFNFLFCFCSVASLRVGRSES